jgi:hypothetical protein
MTNKRHRRPDNIKSKYEDGCIVSYAYLYDEMREVGRITMEEYGKNGLSYANHIKPTLSRISEFLDEHWVG